MRTLLLSAIAGTLVALSGSAWADRSYRPTETSTCGPGLVWAILWSVSWRQARPRCWMVACKDRNGAPSAMPAIVPRSIRTM